MATTAEEGAVHPHDWKDSGGRGKSRPLLVVDAACGDAFRHRLKKATKRLQA
jgi:hypothetical protein